MRTTACGGGSTPAPTLAHSTKTARTSSKYGSRSPQAASSRRSLRERSRCATGPSRAVVEMRHRERRARDGAGDAERPRRSAHERGLARAELALDVDDGALRQVARERRGERRGLLLRRGRAAAHRRRIGAAGAGAGCSGAPRDGSAAEQLAEAPDIGLERRQEARVVQRRGRVVERQQLDLAARDRRPAAPARASARRRAPPPASARVARSPSARHDARAHELDLALELVAAGGDLLGRRALRAGRAALDERRHVDVAPLEPDRGEQLGQQLAGRATSGRPSGRRGSPARRPRASARRASAPRRRRPANARPRARRSCSPAHSRRGRGQSAPRGSVTAAAAAAAAPAAAAARERAQRRRVAADRARRERREQLLDLARGALGTGDERAVAARRAPRSGARRSGRRTRRSACADRIARCRSRSRSRARRRRTPSIGGVPHLHMPTQSPSRTRAAVARTLPELTAALAGRDDVALVPTMGALHDGHRALLRAARSVGGDGRHVALRQPGAVRAGRGLRALSARRGGRRRDRRRRGRRRRLRARRRDDLPRGLRDEPSIPARSAASSRAARAPATSAASRPSSRASSGSCGRSARSSARRTTSSS